MSTSRKADFDSVFCDADVHGENERIAERSVQVSALKFFESSTFCHFVPACLTVCHIFHLQLYGKVPVSVTEQE